jgi:uracil-DNA glycosylase
MLTKVELNWQDMDYWASGEWQVVEERLDQMDQDKKRYNPSRINMFNAIDAVALKDVKVAIIGQDPYPDPKFCTGYAFSIPKTQKEIPVTLRNIFQEYCTDLHYPTPANGNLEAWVNQGVLLWNAIPTCEAWKSMSHDWSEYEFLTKEIVENLCTKDTVLVFLGSVARRYTKYIPKDSEATSNHNKTLENKDNDAMPKRYYIELSHPSPRGILNSNSPFIGSRLFSTINIYLGNLEKEPINWRL